MSLPLILCITALSSSPAPCSAPVVPTISCPQDTAYETRLEAAGKDPAKLWQVYVWCESTEREREARSVLRKLVRSAPDHAEAREKLGHERYEGKWFTSPKKLDTFKKKAEAKTAKAKGWVKSKFGWVAPDDIPFLSRGMVRSTESGTWISPLEVARLATGWVRQDLEWVSPEEVSHLKDGLWKVKGEWLDLERANHKHSRLGAYWTIPYEGLLLYTTTDRSTAAKALDEMERGMREMRRFYGTSPAEPLKVALLRNQEQYDRFALGDHTRKHEATHTHDMFVIHHAFMAESWFNTTEDGVEYLGMGAAFWDAAAENGDSFGPHAARLAMGLSFANAIDPSTKSIAKAVKRGPSGRFYDEYLEEKVLPPWMSYGSAVYAERFYKDSSIKRGGDPLWARKWSIEAIRNAGGMRSLEKILEFELKTHDREGSQKLLIEAGLVVAFILDGECAPVTKHYQAFRKALGEGKLKPQHTEALADCLLEHESDIRAFAGL